MRYVLFDVRFEMTLNSGNLDYFVSEFSAVLTDENLRTAGKFRFVNEADYSSAKVKLLQYGEDGVVVDRVGNGYKAFREWLPEDACIIIWDRLVIKALNYCGGQARLKKPSNTMVILQILYDNMTSHLKRKTSLSLSDCMAEQKLSCDKKELGDSGYRVDAMLRLFRKLYHRGIEISGEKFADYMCQSRYVYIRAELYFPELMLRKEKAAANEMGMKLKERGYSCTVKGGVVKLHTEYADYTFQMSDHCAEGSYVTHSFYKGPRSMKVKYSQKLSLDQRLDTVTQYIVRIEKQAAYGVGNDEIRRLLEQLS